jgi:hypothetical protein
MDRKDKTLLGALFPKDYANELFDKLQNHYPRTRMSYLIRTFFGMWFDGKIVISQKDINQYKADRRKTNRFGNQIIAGAMREGMEAAAQSYPASSNPHKENSAARTAWDDGWKSFYSKV